MKPLICKEILDNHPTLPIMDDWCCILRHAIAIVWCTSDNLLWQPQKDCWQPPLAASALGTSPRIALHGPFHIHTGNPPMRSSCGFS